MKRKKGRYGKSVAKNGIAGEIVVKYRLQIQKPLTLPAPQAGVGDVPGTSGQAKEEVSQVNNAPNAKAKKPKFKAPAKKNCGGGDVEVNDDKPLRVGKL